MVKTSEVFVAGGQPTITYNPRSELNLDREITAYLDTRYKILCVSGPTKSGKTVLVRRVIPKDAGFWISGGQIDQIDKLWEMIVEKGNAFTTREDSVGSSTSGGVEARASGGVKPFGIGAEAEVASTTSHAREKATSLARTVSVGTAAAHALLKEKRSLVIDDFHYIEQALQRGIVRALKDPIFEGVPVVFIAVSHRAFDAVRAEKEMTGRVAQLAVPIWKKVELREIAERGFNALNVSADDSIVDRLASESFQSPHLMQDFCGELCRSNQILETQPEVTRLRPPGDWDTFFKRKARETAKEPFERLRIGPRQRTDRIPRTLKTGQKCDIYQAVLLAIAHTGPKTELSYQEIRASIKDIMADQIPEGHEVTRVLEQMAIVAREQKDQEPVLDWDKEYQKLHITDPFFAYYLRWGTVLPTNSVGK